MFRLDVIVKVDCMGATNQFAFHSLTLVPRQLLLENILFPPRFHTRLIREIHPL